MQQIQDVRPLEDYPCQIEVQTRWSDNDVFGHLNNAVYYELFDSAINRWLSERTGLSPDEFPALGVVAESSCRFFAEVAFPTTLTVGLAVERLGHSSVTYELALFAGERLAALGTWVHVYIDRQSRRPEPIPRVVRMWLEPLTPDTA